jgi:hypothetical protein
MKARKYRVFRVANRSKNLRQGDYYVGCDCIPRICTESSRWEVKGKSLVPPYEEMFCSRVNCDPLRITANQARKYAKKGPPGKMKNALEAFYRSQWNNVPSPRQIWW